MQDLALVTKPSKGRRTAAETKELIEKVGKARLLGATFAVIGFEYKISESQASRHFDSWAKLHGRIWKEGKSKILVRLNETYSRRLSEAEKKYLKSSNSGLNQEAGFWSKHIIEISDKWATFLKDCGLLAPGSDVMGFNEFKIEKEEPIEQLMTEYRNYLAEAIVGASKPKPVENVSAERT